MPRREPKLKVEILLQDEHLLIVDKPAGAATTPADPPALCVLDLLPDVDRTAFQPAWDLEPEVSGVTVYAKTPDLAEALRAQRAAGEGERVFLALVNGYVDRDGAVDHPLWRDARRKRTRVSRKRGRPSLTEYVIAERVPGATLLEVRPHNDAPEQIRAHLAAIGHPLSVDPVYGGAETILLSKYKPNYRPNQRKPERPLIARLTLHALRVVLTHPVSGGLISLESPPPKDFRATVRQLARLG